MKDSFALELRRKTIHMSSLWMPALLYFAGEQIAMNAFLAGFAVMLVYELIRRGNTHLSQIINRLFANTLRAHETHKLTGATWIMLAACIVTCFFPLPISFSALMVVILADTTASLIGKRYGKHKIKDKSWEGCIAFWLTAVACSLFALYLFPVPVSFASASIIAAFITTLVELYSHRFNIDDNLSIPLSYALILWFLCM